MPVATSDAERDNIISDSYLRSVLDASTHTRQQCLDLIDLVEANALTSSASTPPESPLEALKHQKLLLANLALLRGLNRNAIIKVRNTKQGTAEARQEIDRLHLHLQNLYYEERHLRGEISACESYECVALATKAHEKYLKLTCRFSVTSINNYLSFQWKISLKGNRTIRKTMRKPSCLHVSITNLRSGKR